MTGESVAVFIAAVYLTAFIVWIVFDCRKAYKYDVTNKCTNRKYNNFFKYDMCGLGGFTKCPCRHYNDSNKED